MSITAHGKTYETVQEISGKLAELDFENLCFGLSDGRVTEQHAIYEALGTLASEMGARKPQEAVQHLFRMVAWLQSVDAPVNPLRTEMEVAVWQANNKGVGEFTHANMRLESKVWKNV